MLKALFCPNTPRDRGSVLPYVMFVILAIIVGAAFNFDRDQSYLSKRILHDNIEISLEAAGALWSLNNGYVPVDRATVLANFNTYLQKNLHLDSNNMPLANSPYSGQVKILQFNVINAVPSVDPIKGDTVNNYSIEAVVTTTAKPYFNSLYNSSPYTVTDFARVTLKSS